MEPSQNNREIGWSDSSDSEAWINDEEMGVHNAHEHNSIRRRGPVIQLDRESLAMHAHNATWTCLILKNS